MIGEYKNDDFFSNNDDKTNSGVVNSDVNVTFFDDSNTSLYDSADNR